MYSAPAVNLVLKMNNYAHRFAADEGTTPRGIGIEIITVLVQLLPSLLALCKKKPPEPTPVPASLAAVGVSADTWKNASNSKWSAVEAWNEKKQEFAPAAVRDLARDLKTKDPSLSIKEARVQARAALQTALTEDVETIAMAWHGAK